jgi:hypothetical protein
MVIQELEYRLHARAPRSGGPENRDNISDKEEEGSTIVASRRKAISPSHSKFELVRNRLKSMKSTDSIEVARPWTARARQSSNPLTSLRAVDDVDEVVLSYLRETDQIGRLKRHSYGIYTLGNKQIAIIIKNGKPLVRIGGGAMVHLDVFLVTH